MTGPRHLQLICRGFPLKVVGARLLRKRPHPRACSRSFSRHRHINHVRLPRVGDASPGAISLYYMMAIYDMPLAIKNVDATAYGRAISPVIQVAVTLANGCVKFNVIARPG